MKDVARTCNRYPNIELSYEVEDSNDFQTGESAVISVNLEREEDISEIGPVICPLYPQKKDEGWWLVLGDVKTNTLLAIKRLTLQKKSTIKLDFVPTAAGKFTYKLFFMCDSYSGCDQEYEIEMKIAQGTNEEEEEEEENNNEAMDTSN